MIRDLLRIFSVDHIAGTCDCKVPQCGATNVISTCVLRPGHKGLHRNGWGVRFR